MPTVTYDDRSFLIDGQRVWLVSGSVHYFRVPAALWADRLMKAKRAGLNCISTFVPWNVHEPMEGNWALSDDQDVAAFVRLAGEMGLYVILRPGPYIGGDCDFGGLPGWLAGKSGIAYRSTNAAYTHYFDKYFRQVLPRLADLQVPRGGNVILIQNENEYLMTTMPDRLGYLEFVNQLFRRSGFEIPIITCNLFSEPRVPETVDSVNAESNPVAALKRLRLSQPGEPLLVTELRSGRADQWGQEHQASDAASLARKAMEVLGCGGQYNYYMWQGGTNFAFWGGRHPGGEALYQTTSYDLDAPVAEGGALSRKYYFTRLVNMLASTMGRHFAGCRMDEPGVSIHDSTDVLNIYGPTGRWAVVSNGGREGITTARVSLPHGQELTVSLEPFGAAAVPMDLALSADSTLNWANLTPLGLFWENLLVLHGPAGWDGRICINGREAQAEVPDGKEPNVLEHQGMRLVLVNSDVAMHTWALDEMLMFGPAFVGEGPEDVVDAAGAKQYALLTAEGKLSHRKVKAAAQRAPAAPRLGTWKRISVCTEPVSNELAWKKIDRPRDVDHLGVHYGYAWYRLEIDQPRAKRRHLFLPDLEDRATIYLNGQLVGLWGRGPDAKRSPLAASFKRGRNVLTLLVDNLGRFCSGTRLGECKGLYGRIYDARPLAARKPKLKTGEGIVRRMVPRQLVHLLEELERLPLTEADIDIPLTRVTPIHLSFADVPHHLGLLCNSRVAGLFPCHGKNFGDVTLGPELKRGRNAIKVLLWGEVDPKVLNKLRFYVLLEDVSQGARCSYRPWMLPEPGGPIVGKDRPAWYVANFKCPPEPRSLFLHIVGARKGQMFLNGRNLGRFWTIGPQEYYYLPECWLGEQNELMLFEEGGNIPRRSRLCWRPLGPYRE